MKYLVITLQTIIIIVTLLSAFLIIFTKIPGYGAVCDTEQFYFILCWAIFLIFSLGLLINSIGLYLSGHWKRYRLIIILCISFIYLIVFSLRSIIMTTYFGNEIAVIKNDHNFVKMELFENGKFFVYSFDTSCESENTGIYIINNKILELNYKSDRPNYLGTKYKIIDDEFECLDCILQHESTLYKVD